MAFGVLEPLTIVAYFTFAAFTLPGTNFAMIVENFRNLQTAVGWKRDKKGRDAPDNRLSGSLMGFLSIYMIPIFFITASILNGAFGALFFQASSTVPWASITMFCLFAAEVFLAKALLVVWSAPKLDPKTFVRAGFAISLVIEVLAIVDNSILGAATINEPDEATSRDRKNAAMSVKIVFILFMFICPFIWSATWMNTLTRYGPQGGNATTGAEVVPLLQSGHQVGVSVTAPYGIDTGLRVRKDKPKLVYGDYE